MKNKKIFILCVGMCLALCGCGPEKSVDGTDTKSVQNQYQSEEEVLKAMETEESIHALGNFYTSKYFMNYETHVRLMDSNGDIHEPVAEVLLDEEGNMIKEIGDNEYYFYKPIFKFPEENLNLQENQTSSVVNAGLQYEVDDNGTIVSNKKIIDQYHFPQKGSDGSYASGTGIDDKGIAELTGENNFSDEFGDWIRDIREHAESIENFSKQTDYLDVIANYEAEYMFCYEILAWRDGSYDCYTYPSGMQQIEIRARDDGKYEVCESRTYYLDAEFLENTGEYDEDTLRKEAEKINISSENTVYSSVKAAMTTDVANLEPQLSETRYYLVDSMPESLKSMIHKIQEAM